MCIYVYILYKMIDWCINIGINSLILVSVPALKVQYQSRPNLDLIELVCMLPWFTQAVKSQSASLSSKICKDISNCGKMCMILFISFEILLLTLLACRVCSHMKHSTVDQKTDWLWMYEFILAVCTECKQNFKSRTFKKTQKEKQKHIWQDIINSRPKHLAIS